MSDDEYIKECLKLADKLLQPCCGKQPEIELENNMVSLIVGPRFFVQCSICNKEHVATDTGSLISKWNGKEHNFNDADKVTLSVSL